MSTMETAPYQIVVLRLEQHHLWLVRPMREWQSLLHKVQMFVPGGGGGIHVFVSLCLSPGSPILCQVQDLLLACLQQFLEHAAHCGVLQCPPKSLYWYSELSCRTCRHLYISAEGDLGVFCPKQVDRRCLWGFDRLQYGAHGQASAVWVAWAACTL